MINVLIVVPMKIVVMIDLCSVHANFSRAEEKGVVSSKSTFNLAFRFLGEDSRSTILCNSRVGHGLETRRRH